MERSSNSGKREYWLDPPGHPRGVSCDALGPALGPVRLLTKTARGFEPLPAPDLQDILDRTYGRSVDCTGLLRGLETVARALNDGDLARAMMATLLLRLSPLDDEEASRANEALTMLKASADDPKHPGWSAGTPGGLGGKFRPKNLGSAEEAKELVERRLKRLIARRAYRAALRRIMTWRRFLRLGGETLSNAVPGLDVIGDAAMAYDIADMTNTAAELNEEATVAEQFAEKAPYTLEQLRVDPADKEFPSYAAFQKTSLAKVYGPAGRGFEYHHIVEQSAEGDVPLSELNSTRNIVKIPKLIHEEINSDYTQIPENAPEGDSLRSSLRGASFEKRYEEGLEAMRRVGILQ